MLNLVAVVQEVAVVPVEVAVVEVVVVVREVAPAVVVVPLVEKAARLAGASSLGHTTGSN